jgi:cold shock CspA family protein
MPTGTVTWIDSVRGCCFISTDPRARDLYADQAEIDSRSRPLQLGAAVEFAVRTGRRGRLVVTNVVANAPAQPAAEPSQSEVAAEVWEGEGGAFR